ncbi:LysR family transcriptional regulator [Chelatococcus asaccharovorans]|uniref:LysR family transcriptional regulator n=1 Tax=Chelatococcus asaccharovorans TaxID=28210 RepID=UPI00224C6D96|nr:LysR family transcriptional regulator [Chelatococcus asaccharovorans]CAH1664693.1 HTH lysR-type domain-containing protein [Chelatococcus asaccharovorans]CAH1682278.1 HTH lysR-type domain-containing protein [Chelatococcus asaccharovorans]
MMDLNLLAVFDAIYVERNVTRAAERLGLSQPATSAALGRLRQSFDDELFIRRSGGVEPTPRAEALAARIRGVLLDIRDLHEERNFDPVVTERTFAIGMSGYAALTILPALSDSMAMTAPGISLHVKPVARGTAATMLERGDIVLAVDPESDTRAGARRSILYQETFACIARQGAFALPLSIDDFCNANHLLVALGGGATGIIDRKLSELGKTRKVSRTVPEFLLAPWLISLTEKPLLATLPGRLVEMAANVFPVERHRLPFKTPTFAVALLWHERDHRDEAHCWLREMVRQAAKRGSDSKSIPKAQARSRQLD